MNLLTLGKSSTKTRLKMITHRLEQDLTLVGLRVALRAILKKKQHLLN